MITYFLKPNFILLLALLCISGKVFAQETEETTGIETKKTRFFDDFRCELGLNTVPLFRTISGRGQDSLQLSPYLINGRVAWRGFGIRASVGGRRNKSNAYIEGFKDSELRVNTSINYRVGADYRINWSNKASFGIGADWVSRSVEHTRRLDSGFDVIEFENLAYFSGGGISLTGIYWPSQRLGLGLEASAYYLKGQLDEGRKFVNFPELNDGLTTTELEETSLPVGLFVIWRF